MSTATVQSARVVFTYEDLRQLPEDRQRYEVIDGDLLVTPAPTTSHQRASARLVYRLTDRLDEPGIATVLYAPVDVIFSGQDIVQPDIVAVRAENRRFITERGIECAPDLVVEILSPSTSARDRGVKAKLYASYGVREYWLVDLASKRVEVRVLGVGGFESHATQGPGGTLASTIFPFEMPIDDVFA
ncbi:MAG: Uma2 family endonuclease [Phycisphaerales bacterium]|nr:Uma2 family endonuclease [Phycisphaerales bacterium]